MRYNHVFMISGVKMVSSNISRAHCSEAISKPLLFISSLFGINYKERSRILYRLRRLSKAPLQHQYWYQTFQSASIKGSAFILSF